jgi:hypothetical protein
VARRLQKHVAIMHRWIFSPAFRLALFFTVFTATVAWTPAAEPDRAPPARPSEN